MTDRVELVGLDRREGGLHLLAGVTFPRPKGIDEPDDVSGPWSIGHDVPLVAAFVAARRTPYDRAVLTDIARRAAADFSDVAAYVTEAGWSITYAELDRAADETAAGLAARGVREGDAVGLVIPSTVDYVVLYLALARLGAVTAGINPRLKGPEIASCLAVLDPRLTVATDDFADQLEEAGEEFEIARMTPGADAASVAAAFRIEGADPAQEPVDDDDRPVCVCFTSGSTGMPKGAWYTNRQLRRIAELDTGGAWGGGGHGISATQMAHVGFMTKLPWLLASGGTTHLLDRWSAGPVLRLIAEHKMPAVNGVAPQLALMLQHPLVDELDFSAVKAIVAGGAASPPALVERPARSSGPATRSATPPPRAAGSASAPRSTRPTTRPSTQSVDPDPASRRASATPTVRSSRTARSASSGCGRSA